MLDTARVKGAKKIRILLADDHSLVRQGFRRILEGQSDMTVVGEAPNGRVAVEMVGQMLITMVNG